VLACAHPQYLLAQLQVVPDLSPGTLRLEHADFDAVRREGAHRAQILAVEIDPKRLAQKGRAARQEGVV
jgi:hypothetical protein